MTCISTYFMCLFALLFLAADGSPVTGAVNQELKIFNHYPGIGNIYTATANSFNWTQAFESGGMLAVPNSEAEADVYKTIIATLNPIYQNIVYIGFHDLFINGQYETVDDTPLSRSGYTRWSLGAPNVSPTLRCGGFSKDGGLLNVDCTINTANVTYMCEKPLWGDYELVPGVGHYKFHVVGMTWPNAWKACRDEDSHLAVINSVAEHKALQDIFARYQNIPEADRSDFAYVGVHVKFAYNRFRTVKATSLTNSGYSTWEPGQPGVGIDDKNYDVVLQTGNHSLAMIASWNRLPFLCEHELLPDVTTPFMGMTSDIVV